MSEITRLIGCTDAIEGDFVEHEATPKNMMQLALQRHLSVLSLSHAVTFLEILGIGRARSPVHNWVQQSDLEPEAGRDPDKIALDATGVKINRDRFWLYAAVEPETSVIPR